MAVKNCGLTTVVGSATPLNFSTALGAKFVPVATFLATIKNQSYAVAAVLFLALAGAGLVFSLLHLKQMRVRESASAQLHAQNSRFTTALNNMSQGICIFDGERRLVVCNNIYARLYRS